MSFLLDTCTISEVIKKKPSWAVTNWLRLQDQRQLFLSVVTIGEIEKGIASLRKSNKRAELRTWVDEDLALQFQDRILGVNPAVARRWGDLQAVAKRARKSIPILDSLIAATALTHSLTVVTRNERDFAYTGVDIINPWPP